MAIINPSISCSPTCHDIWIGNKICNLECMNEACLFDGGDCEWLCSLSSCDRNSSDGVCDTSCNTNVCGFDFGDCGYCAPNCTKELYFNSECDSACNLRECNFDDTKCVWII